MQAYQHKFLEFAMQSQVLRFGEFTLKSGRISPYFFNSGLFNHGLALAKLGRFYAQALMSQNAIFDMLFGPAYKGIPLAAACSIALADQHQKDLPYAFNRKEAKDHGEGGNVVGAALAGKIMIIDDVISAGTSVRESMTIIQQANAQAAGVVIALDRQERGQGDSSAIKEIEQQFAIPVMSIVTLNHVIEFLQQKPNMEENLQAVLAYKRKYGADTD